MSDQARSRRLPPSPPEMAWHGAARSACWLLSTEAIEPIHLTSSPSVTTANLARTPHLFVCTVATTCIFLSRDPLPGSACVLCGRCPADSHWRVGLDSCPIIIAPSTASDFETRYIQPPTSRASRSRFRPTPVIPSSCPRATLNPVA